MRSQRSPLAPSIYGQLAGALYGADAIPARWRAQLVMRDRIEELADELFALADRVASAGPSPSLDTPASPPAQPAPPGDSYWVLDGQLLAGPYPGAEEGRGRRQARSVLDAGVTCFVDLTDEGEGPPLHPYSTLLRQIARKRKTRVTPPAVADPRQRHSHLVADARILSAIRLALAEGERVYRTRCFERRLTTSFPSSS